VPESNTAQPHLRSTDPFPQFDQPVFFEKSELNALIENLRQAEYQVMGPRVADEAIVYAEVGSAEDLPLGYRDEQQAGAYQVAKSGNNEYFEFNVGPHSWKQFLFPPSVTVSRAERIDSGWTFESEEALALQHKAKLAFIGVRACELAAIAVQDRVFMEGPYVDPVYKQRRESCFIVAVNCTTAASTCFCSSMGTGPNCKQQAIFDLELTELTSGFLLEVGSPRGKEIADSLESVPATASQQEEAHLRQQRAVQQMTKRFDTSNLREVLLGNLDHPHWEDVSKRCLSCTNCTMVCPTCFCSSVSEVTDLVGDQVERRKQWDSCFNVDFGYTAQGTVRNETRSRYRQWLTHKLASWHDQFDTSGCVGCGRCITWCPVGIDLTEEVAAIGSDDKARRTLPIIEKESQRVCQVEESTP
jgi:sulfhydrogenase subunit beta (sulfur reductase)